MWAPLGELWIGVPPENATTYPHPGEVLWYPGGVSETTELLIAYGRTHFASKAGVFAGNHFLTITSGLEHLPKKSVGSCSGRAPSRFASTTPDGCAWGRMAVPAGRSVACQPARVPTIVPAASGTSSYTDARVPGRLATFAWLALLVMVASTTISIAAIGLLVSLAHLRVRALAEPAMG